MERSIGKGRPSLVIYMSQSGHPAVMEVKIDDYGFIVIPKEVRDHLGIESGAALKISIESEGENGGAITLRLKGQKPPLRRKGTLLVHSGELTEEVFDVVEQLRVERTERARRHAGMGE